ncbi:hypothetical protein RvY_00982 [Ramazzottius varieornatus]|uniref:Uncharacterized protein n=1 Tax=Ramazzottius varieornatus TaxID=947166 RepID=A0A1D1UPG1_RAMVA|nr:hypothetical protein RvY_00982 [Ramazzottius varieornatus]
MHPIGFRIGTMGYPKRDGCLDIPKILGCDSELPGFLFPVPPRGNPTVTAFYQGEGCGGEIDL